MNKLLENYMPLQADEHVLYHLEGDAFNEDPSIIARTLAFIERIISVILGRSKKIHFFVTDFRLIAIEYQKILWIFDNSIHSMTISPRSINEFGYRRERSFLLFISHYFVLGTVSVRAFGGKSAVFEMVNQVEQLTEKVGLKKSRSLPREEKKPTSDN